MATISQGWELRSFPPRAISTGVLLTLTMLATTFLTRICIATASISQRPYLRHAREERAASFRNRAAQLYRLMLAIGSLPFRLERVCPGVFSFANTSERKSKLDQVRVTFDERSPRRAVVGFIYLTRWFISRRWFYRNYIQSINENNIICKLRLQKIERRFLSSSSNVYKKDIRSRFMGLRFFSSQTLGSLWLIDAIFDNHNTHVTRVN